ncbi:MAG TPA: BamA/TamA family outer membrane protein [Selenomonadales bacterium]|nr:BamA/TamA family outer membrane protein [Selenomonadales bacterium]
MKARRRFGHFFLATVVALGLVFSSIAPIHAADLTGRKVVAVNVTGNSSVTESEVLAVTKVKPGDSLEPAKVQQDMRAIYELGSFFDVVANFTEVPEGVKVVYTVLENPVLKDIVVQGNTKVSTDKLISLLGVAKDKVLNTKALNDGARNVEQYYHDQGFILARVSDVSMNPNGVLSVTVNEGVLEGVVVKGNDKTKTYVITREMKLKPGEVFNVKDARRSMQKVYNLGYFEDVNMKLNPGRDPNAVVLQTDVVEQKTGMFSIGAGYSENDGMVGIIELGDNNFRGTGDKVKIHWEFGGKASDKNYSFGYTRPWLDSRQTSLGFSVYDMTNEYTDYDYQGDDNKKRSRYDRNRKGWDITIARPYGEYLNYSLTFKNRKDTYEEYVNGPVDYKAPVGGEHYDADYNAQYLDDNFGLTRSIILNRTFDSRDNIFSPTEGTRFSVTAELAGKALGGDFSFNKFTVEDRQYFKVGKSQVIATRLTAGYGDGKMPDSAKFAVGGTDTLRGYNDDQFKGDKMLAATAEYRFPIVKKVEGVVFGDIGNAWEGEGYKLDDLKTSVGVGIRVNSPIGPIRLDYARGEEGGKAHFSFGGQF